MNRRHVIEITKNRDVKYGFKGLLGGQLIT